MSTKTQPEEPLDSTEILEEEVRERDIDLKGKDTSLKELQKQVIEIANLLAVSNDFPIIKGELEKLLCFEDDNILLKAQLRTLKNKKSRKFGTAFLGLKKKTENLEGEVKQLKSRRQIDKYKLPELVIEITKKVAKTIWFDILKVIHMPRWVWRKIRG